MTNLSSTHRSCHIKKMLGLLATLGAPMQNTQSDELEQTIEIINDPPDEGTYTGNTLNGKRHGKGVMHYKNNDTYDGDWKNDKMNGRGEFKKNVQGLRYKWEMYGDFIDNCPINGRLSKHEHDPGSQIPGGSHGVNILKWDPYDLKKLPGRELTPGEAEGLQHDIEKDAAKQMNDAYERRIQEEQDEENKKSREKSNKELAEKMMHGGGFKH